MFLHRRSLQRAMLAGERQIFFNEPWILPPEEERVHMHAKRNRLVRNSQAWGLGAIGRYHAIDY